MNIFMRYVWLDEFVSRHPILETIVDRYYQSKYDFEEWFEESLLVPKVCMKVIHYFHGHKHNSLAIMLHDFAGQYQRRPQEGWKAPDDWDCWKE